MEALKKYDYTPNYNYEDYKQWEGDWELIGGLAYAMAPALSLWLSSYTHLKSNYNIN